MVLRCYTYTTSAIWQSCALNRFILSVEIVLLSLGGTLEIMMFAHSFFASDGTEMEETWLWMYDHQYFKHKMTDKHITILLKSIDRYEPFK